jgi:ERCC4-type nuclease
MNGDFASMFRAANLPRTVVVGNEVVHSNLSAKLRERGIKMITRTTRGADYIIGNDVGVLYVKHKDLLKNDHLDKAFCERIDVIKETFPIPLLIYERGNCDQIEGTQTLDKFSHQLIAFFTVVKRIHSISVTSEDEGCDLIDSMARLVSH